MKLLALEKKADLIKSVGQKKPAKDKAEKMLQLCGDSNFWNTLQRVLEHLGPLLSSTEQWGLHLALNRAALHLCWATAHLYEKQTSTGVTAMT
ncbi:TPA: hypothetical protein ACH3X1_000028 [Trebouxia sp. C0004]